MDNEKQYIIYHFSKVGQIIKKTQLSTTNYLTQPDKYMSGGKIFVYKEKKFD
jgi:hypothetical protein